MGIGDERSLRRDVTLPGKRENIGEIGIPNGGVGPERLVVLRFSIP